MAAPGAKPSGSAAIFSARSRSTWRSARPPTTAARSPCPIPARRTPNFSAPSPPRYGPRCRTKAPAGRRRASWSNKMLRPLLAALALLTLAGTAHADDPDALWKIIHDKCLPNEEQHGQPAPCPTVDLSNGKADGFVVLKARGGGTQYLVMPTAKITGIEDPAV